MRRWAQNQRMLHLQLIVDKHLTAQFSAFRDGPFVKEKSGLRFSTKGVDDETGHSYFGYRYYNSQLSRWANRDPLGESESRNLLVYAENHPTITIDPTGLAIYAFDGTHNDGNVDWVFGEETNVPILASLYDGTRVYINGVGTRDGGVGNFLGDIGGAGGDDRIVAMMKALERQVACGDETIDIVGFSRGAAQAREFANRIKDQYPTLEIRFLGLFDSVGSFGLAGNEANLGYRMAIPDSVLNAFHIVAKDEFRSVYPLSSILSAPGVLDNPNYIEISMRGAHSDIGGGYPDQRGYANDALGMMHFAALSVGVPFKAIPGRYRDYSQKNGPHDSRYFNDRIRDLWRLVTCRDPRPRQIFYHPPRCGVGPEKGLNIYEH